MVTIWAPEIDESPGVPRYVAIADAIANDIDRGALRDGARLPTHRDLAERLGVTVGTVTRGYAEAERRGLTVGEVGRGTFVRTRTDPEGFGWMEAAQVGTDGSVIDMSLACLWVPPDGEDGRALGATLAEIARSHGLDELVAYDPATAPYRHRTIAAEWIESMGLHVPPDQLVVTNGAQHAITAILASHLRPGDTLLAAHLTYPGLKAVAQMLGLQLRGVAMDEEGIEPDALAAACRDHGARALYCIPTIQNPTSATMSAGRREEIANIARRHGLTLIEDQIHVGAPGEHPTPLAAFAPERTLFVATLSKWATFGLRIGFVAAPESAAERVRSAVRSSLWMPAPLMTEIATRWIANGTAARLAETKLRELAARHEIVREVLGDRFHVRTDPRAPYLWIELPEPLRSDECVVQARQRGLSIAGAEAFTVGRDVPHAVRVSIAPVPHREQVRKGIRTLAEILSGTVDPRTDIL